MILRLLSVGFTLVFMFGCTQVKPWEKGILAKDTMQSSGGNSLTKQYEEHIYFSKEASKGGSGVAGGGCGCN